MAIIPYGQRHLREWQMSNPLSLWLRVQGCTSIYAEVPFIIRTGYKAGTRHVDLIGVRSDGLIVAVEMKKSLCWGLMRQGISLRRAAALIYCAVDCRPTPGSVAEFAKCGLGVLTVRDGIVSVLLEAKLQTDSSNRERLKIEQGKLNGIAGLPVGRRP